ncbi:transglycosylase domain-containing protein [Streptomyces sp. CBMA152]|uniref:transglycosylase domain-containing protein n=1 Tax=Streptomyces sp. CBMA152 TaxID=1896312 RepID=UPI0016614DAA|nr:transglycosylase domain-containing protein [Streptomyces sp. CBMA152]MBD0745289.1 penicillin-binding protein [Streptomyces sp. CBMA152]
MGRAEERRARQRGARRDQQKKGGRIRRLFTWKKMLGAFFGFILLVMGGFYIIYLMTPIPKANAAAQLESNVYKLSNGKIIARTGQLNREVVGLDKIPEKVQLDFVAAENMSFYKDSGVDFRGTARGLLNTLSGKGKQGGSTITQQYVKNFYLSQDQTVTRKLKELVISLKVDQKYDKKEILAGYINTSYYGRNAYGIQAAAQAYYGVDSSKLTTEQGAYLAALLQAPSQYDWAVASETGKKLVTARWNYVLDNMVKMNELDAAQRAGMKFPTPMEPKPDPGMEGQTGYFVQAAKAELVRNGISEADLAKGGWTITLNIDPKKQALLEGAVKQELTSKLDKKRKVDQDIQAGAVSVDPKTGSVVALYGGQDYMKHQLSNARTAAYQPASTFKPLILAAALNNKSETQDGKEIKASTIYNGDSKRPVKGDGGKSYNPPNEDDMSYGPITVQTAMNKSVNSVFAQMGVDVGLPKLRDTAVALGLNHMKGVSAEPSMTLGSYGASPMEMAGAYATLDNHGKLVTPSIVKSATHKVAKYNKPDPIGDQVISREAADSVTSVLTGVVDDGTAKTSVRDAPNRDGQPVAGKTGTSDDNKSAWFTGYTPSLVTSVGLWGEAAGPRTIKVDGKDVTVGKGSQVPLTDAAGTDGRVNGGGLPAKIWSAYTFDAVGSDDSKFDLNTDQGAAVQPDEVVPSNTPSHTPSNTPSHTPSKDPTKSPTHSPTHTPTKSPTTGGTSTGQANGGTSTGQANGGTTTGQANGGTTTGQANGGTTTGQANGGTTAGPGGGTADPTQGGGTLP